jgi:hypothetical protein
MTLACRARPRGELLSEIATLCAPAAGPASTLRPCKAHVHGRTVLVDHDALVER